VYHEEPDGITIYSGDGAGETLARRRRLPPSETLWLTFAAGQLVVYDALAGAGDARPHWVRERCR
jgi:hypothetical protein